MDGDLIPVAPPKSTTYQRAGEAALFLRSSLPVALHNPRIAIVCGSGLGGLAETIHEDPRVEIAYEAIPNFPQTTG